MRLILGPDSTSGAVDLVVLVPPAHGTISITPDGVETDPRTGNGKKYTVTYTPSRSSVGSIDVADEFILKATDQTDRPNLSFGEYQLTVTLKPNDAPRVNASANVSVFAGVHGEAFIKNMVVSRS